MTYTLGESSVVYGRILDLENEEPIAEVDVEVFAHNIDGEEALLLGTGVTDESGVYRVVIPSPDTNDFFSDDAAPKSQVWLGP